MVSTRSTFWLQRLVHVAFSYDSLQRLSALVEVIGRAAGATQAVLWEETEDRAGSAIPSVLARWPSEPSGTEAGRLPASDLTTLAAFRTRTLALPTANSPNGSSPAGGDRVMAALPVDYVDGYPGVLTLMGTTELTEEAFDVVADLLDVLPEMSSMLRERQALALVHGCNAVLHRADLESPDQPLSQDRLSHHFSEVCGLVAKALHCTDVSIYLRELDNDNEVFPLFASSSNPPPGPHRAARPRINAT